VKVKKAWKQLNESERTRVKSWQAEASAESWVTHTGRNIPVHPSPGAMRIAWQQHSTKERLLGQVPLLQPAEMNGPFS